MISDKYYDLLAENFDFWQKLRFVGRKFRFLTKITIFWPKISIFDKNYYFWPKILIFDKNYYFLVENFDFWQKILFFGRKFRLLQHANFKIFTAYWLNILTGSWFSFWMFGLKSITMPCRNLKWKRGLEKKFFKSSKSFDIFWQSLFVRQITLLRFFLLLSEVC